MPARSLALVFAVAGMAVWAGCGGSSVPPAAPAKVPRTAPKQVAQAPAKAAGAEKPQVQPEAPRKRPQSTTATKKSKKTKPAVKVEPPAESDAKPADAKPERPSPAPTPKQAAGQGRPTSPDKPELLTQENYEKIQPGMTRAEVVAVLGPQASSVGSGKSWKLTWRPRGTKGKEIEIQFHDGAVTSKKSTMPWAVAASPPTAEAPSAEVAKVDKLQRIIDDLHGRDSKKFRPALRYLKDAEVDEERAPEVSKAIQRHLASKDFGISSEAEAAIRRWVTKENVPYFLKVLSRPVDSRDATDDNREQQPLAMAMLVKLREPQGVAPIAKLLTRFFDRDDAKKALLELGPELAEDEVLKYANHKDFNTATAAREILAEFKTGSGKRLDQYLADLQSPVADKRLWAAQAIGDMPVDSGRKKEVALALEKLLPDKYGWPAHAAASALGTWGIRENEPALIQALGHVSPDMRRLAAAALAKVGTRQSLAALQKVAGGEKLHPETAEAAKTAIAAINGRK